MLATLIEEVKGRIPEVDGCRCFLKIGGETIYSRGFKNKEQASKWIDAFTGSPFAPAKLDWRVGFLFRLRGVDLDFEIVRRDGKKLKR